MPRRYPAEFGRRVLDLIAERRPVAEVAADLGISPQVIYNWRKQDLIDRGEASGLTSTDRAELVAARRRIAELNSRDRERRRAGDPGHPGCVVMGRAKWGVIQSEGHWIRLSEPEIREWCRCHSFQAR
jgi:transposase